MSLNMVFMATVVLHGFNSNFKPRGVVIHTGMYGGMYGVRVSMSRLHTFFFIMRSGVPHVDAAQLQELSPFGCRDRISITDLRHTVTCHV